MVLMTAMTIFLQFGCDSGTGPSVGQWEFLGFQDKFALRMVLAEPYLYVGAGSDGVWRRNIRQSTQQWEYLGLRDTTLGRYTNVGALDIDVLGEDILVAYNGSARHVAAESTISVWRSTNGGASWFRSDAGIPESIYPYEPNTLSSLQRSPHEPNIVLAKVGPAIYRSTNSGYTWLLVDGRRGAAPMMDHIRWNPTKPGEAWFFGETSVFAPYMFRTTDYGETFGGSVNFNALGFPADAAIYDVAFDARNADVIYAATSEGVIKTTDGGYTWRNNAITLPRGRFVFRMAHHPLIGGTLYLGGGRSVYVTHDAGKSVRLLGEIKRGFITSLVLDVHGNQLFAGTTDGGIYVLKLSVGE